MGVQKGNGRGTTTLATTVLRALVVDDEALPREVFSSYLKRLGCHVQVAGEGNHALGLLEAAPVDLILLDRRMPDMSGEEAVALLRSHPHAADAWIVGISADSEPAMVEDWKQKGLDAFCIKPLNLATMSRIVREARGSRPAGAQAPQPGAPEDAPVLDMEAWEGIRALGGRVGTDLQETMRSQFSETSQRLIAEMDEALALGSRSRVERAAHSLGGCAATVGARRLSARCRELKQAAGGAPFDRMQECLGRVKTACHEASVCLRSA